MVRIVEGFDVHAAEHACVPRHQRASCRTRDAIVSRAVRVHGVWEHGSKGRETAGESDERSNEKRRGPVTGRTERVRREPDDRKKADEEEPEEAEEEEDDERREEERRASDGG